MIKGEELVRGDLYFHQGPRKGHENVRIENRIWDLPITNIVFVIFNMTDWKKRYIIEHAALSVAT
jgi:hypothetical protein